MEIVSKIINVDGFEARFTGYIRHNDESFRSNRIRPALLVLPGGGYQYTSVREAEPIALKFSAMGYQTFVLDYSCAPSGARYPVALNQAKTAMKMIRENAEIWHIDPKKVAVTGFSAGGHLAASLCCLFDEDSRPDAAVLCYPVITAEEAYTHRGSIENLSGESLEKVDKDFFSMETRVQKNTPPTFLWHTWQDGSVNVMNSLKYAEALKKEGIIAELHIFPFGGHGLSLSTDETGNEDGTGTVEECASWPELANRFLKQVM
ncbi:MAG: alpha/beta hydrolase [Lachnospiraceae bacterium]|nr:alpha/beta hydrolase [Lachnospiraceae bacterium]